MSSLRNALKRKEHKERSQPGERKKYGLLEKHKDYVLRARDYNAKEKRLKVLKEKAAFRNPDEFYFAMEKTQMKGGVHRSERNPSVDMDMSRLLKTQDLNYVTMKQTLESKKVKRISESLSFTENRDGMKPMNKHKIFVDSKEERDKWNPEEHFDTPQEMLGRAFNRPKKSFLKEEKLVVGGSMDLKSRKKIDKAREKKYGELLDRMEREEKLRSVAQQMDMQKHVMGKGRKRKVGGGGEDGSPVVYKWKKERKK